MSKTPQLPDWIRNAEVSSYECAHRLIHEETGVEESRLFGTEDLYGDWGGHTLLLLKDFASSKFVKARIDDDDRCPYRHDPRLRSNIRLNNHIGRVLNRSADATTCGILYGSAVANLLRADGKMSGHLPNERSALDYGAKVVRFVTDTAQMPNLKVILAMGNEACSVLERIGFLPSIWPTVQNKPQIVMQGSIPVIPCNHPRVATNEQLSIVAELASGLVKRK